ncbi:TPA: BMP family protein [Klebsiella pneumoniae]|nr:BMP family protein [Klebsiella pneumoniae]
MRTINLKCFPHGGLAALVVLMGLLMTSSGAFAQKSAAFLLPGSINDQSWNSEGFKSTERFKELGWNVTYSENVQAADMVESMRQYARKGVDVVVGHSGRFLSAAQRVGPEFPKTLFLIGSGATGSGKNVASIEYDNAQFGYLMGVLAARMSKTNKIGAISGLEGLPTVTAQVGAFRKGAISVRPNIEVKVIYLQSMEDPTAAKEAALSLITRGADVVSGKLNAGQAGLIKAAKERGVFVTGRSLGHTQIAPEAVLANVVEEWPEMYAAAVQQNKTESVGGKYLIYGLGSSGTTGARLRYSKELEFNPAVPASVVGELEKIKKQLASGQLKINVTRQDARGGI